MDRYYRDDHTGRGAVMGTENNDCPICGIPLDDNHFYPSSFPGIDDPICCNCDENLSLMFTNFEKGPGDEGFIVPDNSVRLKQITGRSYLENRLIFLLHCLKKRQFSGDLPGDKSIERLKAEVEKVYRAIEEGKD